MMLQIYIPRLGLEHINTVVILNYLKRQGRFLVPIVWNDHNMKNEDNFGTSTEKLVYPEQIALISAWPNTDPIGGLTVRNYSAVAFDSSFHTGMTQCKTKQFVRYVLVLYWRVDFRTVIELELAQ